MEEDLDQVIGFLNTEKQVNSQPPESQQSGGCPPINGSNPSQNYLMNLGGKTFQSTDRNPCLSEIQSTSE